MALDFVRRVCLSLPHATETVQWESLVFKIGGKIFAIAALEPVRTWVSFKCTPDDFADLTERPGIIPAPYLARAQWAALEAEDALSSAELKRCLRQSYDLVLAKLSGKARAALASGGNPPARKPARVK
jgi:predicted DNA-binding protein (MmcQ/YjbR family)